MARFINFSAITSKIRENGILGKSLRIIQNYGLLLVM